jgi:hypothetical protein
MVVSLIALVFSMSGGALAAQHYLLTSTSQIKPSVLRKLEKPALAATPGAPVPGPAGATGATGERGAKGDPGEGGAQGPKGETVIGQRGEKGEQGSLGIERIQQAEGTPVTLLPGQRREEGIEVTCPEGGTPIGGGYVASEATINVYASSMMSNTGWHVSAINTSSTNEGTVTVHVICAY